MSTQSPVPPVNHNPTIPAIPQSANGGSLDHKRTPSMTVTPAGTTTYNTNGTSQNKSNIQFGSVNGGNPAASPAMSTPQMATHQPSSSLGVNNLPNRMASPSGSPSPIPQPQPSGGRPPSSMQNPSSGVNFGAFSGDSADVNGVTGAMSQMRMQDHNRRNSSQSIPTDMPTGPGRGGYPNHAGRGGRGSFSNFPNAPAYSPQNNYRASHQNNRGGYTGRGGGPMGYQNSPSMSSRQPMMHNTNPGTPNMGHLQMVPGMQNSHYGYAQLSVRNPHTPPQAARGNPRKRGSGGGRGNRKSHTSRKFEKPNQPSKDPASENYAGPFPVVNGFAQVPQPFYIPHVTPQNGKHESFLTENTQAYGGVPIAPDPSISYNYQQNFYPQNAPYPPYPPQSPRPHFQPSYGAQMQPTYSNQGQQGPAQMSRQSSQMSAVERPASSVGQTPQTPSAVPHHPSARNPSVSGEKNQYSIPKKGNKIVIKNAAGEVMDFSKTTSTPAPAPSAPPATSTPAISNPPSRTGSAADNTHSRNESQSVPAKDGEDKKKAMQEAVAKKIAEEKEQEAERMRKQKAAEDEKLQMEKEAADAAAREAAEKKAAAERAEQEAQEAEEAKAKAEAAEAAKAAAPDPAEDEEDEFERMAREMEAEEAAREEAEAKAEEEYKKRKAAQKEAEAKREQEEAAAYEANMRQAEREAEEAELAREQKRNAGDGDEEAKKMFAALQTADAPPSSLDNSGGATPDESGAVTPLSESSAMGAPRSIGPSKRGRAAELTLDTKKPVEPPEPSATLKSLTTAKKLSDINQISYPSGFVSPNPALNANAPSDRGFKYNKEFLLQFQSVFKEKPSLDWDQRVRETLGDGDSARPQTARTPSGMGGRSASNRPPANAALAPMGSFGGRPSLPPGSTSEQRFAASNAAMRAGPMGANPFAFGRPGNMGPPMGRSPSNNALGNIPGSPRVGGSGRGGSRAESKRNKQSAKHEHESNKNMPLTAGMQIGTLETTATGWKARSLGQGPNTAAVGPDGYMEADVVQRKVKAALNKMTPEKFDRISDQVLEIAAQSKQESDGRTLRQVIQLVFEKATDEAHWAGMYANFCFKMLSTMSNDIKDENIKDKNNQVVTGGNLFRKYLLNRCQEEFERGWKVNLPPQPEGQADEVAMLSDEYYIAAAAKRRGLGLVKFIGELFKLQMLTERIMHECVKKLLDYEGTPDEAEVESLSSLLRTIGKQLDSSESRAVGRMDAYFERINQTIAIPELPSRLRFMLLDIVDLRKAGWQSKDSDKGPKTITQIHEEAEAARAREEMQKLASQANRGGGARMPIGRGDARSFSSGGYGQVPPPDNSNRVGAEDLRRLGGRNQRNTSTPSGQFGPSGLGARTNSGRRGLGPTLNRPDDSNASSRTGTPPAGKEKDKKDESSMNAFSALADMDSHDGPTSPPSNPASPPVQKSQPIERERSPSPEKKE